MTQRPNLTSKYMAVVFRDRISRPGMATESVTAAGGTPGRV